jgi:Family of unknown function (DUF5761)
MDPVTSFGLSSLSQMEDGVNTRFFSTKNANHLQDRMANIVKQRTGHQISRQDDTALLIIMRRIYADNASNDLAHQDEQLAYLNTKVLEACVPMILTGIKMRLTYLRDISALPVPLERSKSMSSSGLRTANTSFGL